MIPDNFKVTTEPGTRWACCHCLKTVKTMTPCIKIPGEVTQVEQKEDLPLPTFKVQYDFYCDECAIKELIQRRDMGWLKRFVCSVFMGYRNKKKH